MLEVVNVVLFSAIFNYFLLWAMARWGGPPKYFLPLLGLYPISAPAPVQFISLSQQIIWYGKAHLDSAQVSMVLTFLSAHRTQEWLDNWLTVWSAVLHLSRPSQPAALDGTGCLETQLSSSSARQHTRASCVFLALWDPLQFILLI